MTYLTPNHPAVEAAARSAYERAWCGENEPWSEVDDLERDEWRADEAHSLTAALPHLIAEDLPTRLVRDIQVRTIRAAARAATMTSVSRSSCSTRSDDRRPDCVAPSTSPSRRCSRSSVDSAKP